MPRVRLSWPEWTATPCGRWRRSPPSKERRTRGRGGGAAGADPPELGIRHHPRYSTAANDAALRALCRRHLRGEPEPWNLTRVAHGMYGHQPGPAEELRDLDDVYASLDVVDLTVEDVNARVTAAAR